MEGTLSLALGVGNGTLTCPTLFLPASLFESSPSPSLAQASSKLFVSWVRGVLFLKVGEG